MIDKIISFVKRKTSQKYRFNQQYTNNRWDQLRDLAELGRYSIIVGFSKYYAMGGTVLDLGCGEGILQEKYSPADYGHFTGVDFSEVAIENVKKKNIANTTWLVGDLNKLTIEGTYDVIIYNESLNYLPDPKQAVVKLFSNLAPDGVFIVSLVDKHGKEQTGLWQMLDSILAVQERSKVTNLEGNSWTVQVYKMRQ